MPSGELTRHVVGFISGGVEEVRCRLFGGVPGGNSRFYTGRFRINGFFLRSILLARDLEISSIGCTR